PSHRTTRSVAGRDGSRCHVQARPGPHHHRGGQHLVHRRDHEHPGPAPRRGLRRDRALRPEAGEFDVHPGHAHRPVRDAADPGHDRGQPRILRSRLPCPPLPRRHALRGDDDPRQAELEVPPRTGHRHPRTARLQPARHTGGQGRAPDHDVRLQPRGPVLTVSRPGCSLTAHRRPARIRRVSSMALEFKPAWLFVPGDRPDRYMKAAERSDIVILDLEDAANAADKAAARESIIDFPLDPTRTVVRLNDRDSEHFDEDLTRRAQTDYTGVMLPKSEPGENLTVLADYQVTALIETALGAVNVSEIAACPNTCALIWGSEDRIADLGGGSSRTADGDYRDVAQHVRSSTLLAARAHDRYALDSIWADIPNLDGLAAEAEDAVQSGFSGKVSIHPNHVPVVRDAFRPSDEQLRWARAVLDLARTEKGAFAYEGKMIDAPLLKHAELIVARAD